MIRNSKPCSREGIIAPLFAFILPVLLIFSAFAINLSYMQLTTTQLKIASDAASHAGGRALSFHQNTDRAIEAMDQFARLNPVVGNTIVVPQNDAHMQFGQAILTNGRYEFIQHPKDVVDADNSQVIVNSVRVFAEVDTPMAFRFQNANTSFNPTRSSITHQKDRDIAMVIDRSGSMLEFIDTPILDTVLRHLRNNRLISSSELDVSGINSNVRVYTQYYTNNTLTRMLELQDRLDRINHPLADRVRRSVNYAVSMQTLLKSPKRTLNLNTTTPANFSEINTARDWFSRFQNGMVEAAPAYSRWRALSEAMNQFFDVLERTDQEEQVALVVFSSDAQAESILTSDYDLLRETVAEIVPIGGTQIGEGLRRGLKEVVNYENSGEPSNSRRFAEKMIVVMTDGAQNPGGLSPVPVAQNFKRQNPEAIIHTITFGEGAVQSTMQDVAREGGGNHYHASDAGELATEFREIANIPPTIFTY
jgi:hypothetical protein